MLPAIIPTTLLPIALGGALGAVTRHIVQVFITQVFITHAIPQAFPWGTLVVNVAGCFVIGLLSAVFVQHWNPSLFMKLFLITGFLGGFTTFSAFSLDVMTLTSRGDAIGAAAYVMGSVALSLAAAFAGQLLIERIS